MKKFVLIAVIIFAFVSCKTVSSVNYWKSKAEVVNVDVDIITVHVFDCGEYYAFYGDDFKVGDVITVVMADSDVIDAYKE